jgi:hypothetical protein
MLVVVMGGYVTAAALSSAAGPPIGIGGVARVQPLSGWRFVQRVSDGGVPGVLITRGSGSLEVLAGPTSRTPEALARYYATEILQPQANRLQVSDHLDVIALPSGVPAVRFTYFGDFDQSGVPIEGEVTVAVSPAGNGVIFDGWAPEGSLQYVNGDIETMVEQAEVA